MRLYISPPPTPNTGLHVGHVLGPYTRIARARRTDDAANGDDSFHLTHADVHQSYVHRMALVRGIPADELARINTAQIRADLADFGVTVDYWVENSGDRYTRYFRSCYSALSDALSTVERPGFKTVGTGLSAVEAFISGHCRRCSARSKASVCESCLLPVHLADLAEPRGSVHDEELVPDARSGLRYLEVTGAQVESVGEQVRSRLDAVPKAVVSLYDRLRDHNLLLSYPDSWGLEVGDGVVVNAWIEIAFAHLFAAAAVIIGRDPTDLDEARAALLSVHDLRVTYAYGRDNTYYYAFVLPYVFITFGLECLLPDRMIVSGFLTVDGAKMSSSTGNVHLAADLARDVDQVEIDRLIATAEERGEDDFDHAVTHAGG